jgi:hypothetical protein
MNPKTRNYLAGLVLLVALSLSMWPLRAVIISDMFWHMDIQIPLLIAVGVLMQITPSVISKKLSRLNAFGLSSFIASQMILAFWMLPISIDRAIIYWEYDLAKIISLIICGWLMQISFRKTTLVIEVFFVGYFLAMMLWVGLYYLYSDVRLCNVYSQASQQYAGGGIIFIGVTLSLVWVTSKFTKKMALKNKALL